jgi:hypothetical protein
VKIPKRKSRLLRKKNLNGESKMIDWSKPIETVSGWKAEKQVEFKEGDKLAKTNIPFFTVKVEGEKELIQYKEDGTLKYPAAVYPRNADSFKMRNKEAVK